MKNELSKRRLKKMISSDFTDLSTEEIKALIQKEADKGPDEIDTDYIDLCFELLSIKNNPQNAGKKKIARPAKVLFAAAVLMVVIVSTMTVSAQLHLNIPQKIAQFINGNVEIDYNLEHADTTADGYALLDTDLAKQLSDYGISPVTFPEEMTKENCKITEIELVMDEDIIKIANIDFEYSGQTGSLYIQHRPNNSESAGVIGVTEVESGQIIKVNGMDVLVFEQKDSCFIRYKDNSTIYEFSLFCDLETAMKFANSIK